MTRAHAEAERNLKNAAGEKGYMISGTWSTIPKTRLFVRNRTKTQKGVVDFNHQREIKKKKRLRRNTHGSI